MCFVVNMITSWNKLPRGAVVSLSFDHKEGHMPLKGVVDKTGHDVGVSR